MSKRNIYQGPRSCWARHEKVYVPGSGIDAKSASGILALIEKELRRGFTYDHSCRRVKMTPALARKRAVYLVALAKKHKGASEARRVAEIVRRWLLRGAVRRKVEAYAVA